MNLDPVALRQLVEFGQERRGVEFKASTDWTTYASKFTKAIMAMANKRDGGVIIVGWDASAGAHGILPEHESTFDIDTIQPHVNRYAAPYVEVVLQPFEVAGTHFLAIGAEEFRDIPVICQRDSTDGVLKRGRVYVRSFRTVETTEVQTPEDSRDLLELATDKGVERFVRRAARVGVDVTQGEAARSRQAFDEELRRALG